MIQKINLRESVNALTELFRYKRVGTLNNHMLNVLQAETSLSIVRNAGLSYARTVRRAVLLH